MPEEGVTPQVGAEINAIAMPSQIEIMQKEHLRKKEAIKSADLEKLYEKYGGERHVQMPDELRFAAVENEEFPSM